MKTPAYPISDHFDGKTFFNPKTNIDKSLSDVLRWKAQGTAQKWPDFVSDNVKPLVSPSVPVGKVHYTFINHVTFLIQLNQLNILTDPVFAKRTSPVGWAGPSRHRAPGMSIEELPSIQVVFLSHNHYDHLDVESVRKIVKLHNPLFVTPLGNKKHLLKAGAEKIVELDWWESTTLTATTTLHLTSVQHWSSRTPWDRNESLWGGFVIESSGLKIYFAGDTGYGDHFKETRKRYGAMDLSLIPIGAYEPRWFMKEQHMNPADAVQAHQDLESKLSVGMHFGTFQLTDEAIEQPVIDLKAALAEAKIPDATFIAPKNGQSGSFPQS